MSTSSIRPLLEQRRAELQQKIAAAAKVGDDSRVLAGADDLRALAGVLSRVSNAEREAAGLLGLLTETESPPRLSRSGGESLSPRDLGVRVRAEFVARAAAAGLKLTRDRGSIYRGTTGVRIGTAVATERVKNRWFLGIGEDSFDAAVLLCVPDRGATIDICLPQSFFATHGRHLSRAGGQFKFNVARRGADLILKVPGQTPERVNHLVGEYAGLER